MDCPTDLLYPWRLQVWNWPEFASRRLTGRIGAEMFRCDRQRLSGEESGLYGFRSRSERDDALGAIRSFYGWTSAEPVNSRAQQEVADRRPKTIPVKVGVRARNTTAPPHSHDRDQDGAVRVAP